MDDIVRELDKWAPPGSYLSLFNRFSCEQQLQLFANGGLTLPPSDSNEFDVPDDFVNLTKIELIHGNCCKGSELERLGPAKLPDEPQDRKEGSRHRLEDYDTVRMLTLSIDAAAAGGMSADSRVMVGMLITRFIQTQRKVDGKTLVAEIRDPRTQELMAFTNCTDSIVGNEIVAMILAMAQIAEDVDIRFVMEDLFSEEGMECMLRTSACSWPSMPTGGPLWNVATSVEWLLWAGMVQESSGSSSGLVTLLDLVDHWTP